MQKKLEQCKSIPSTQLHTLTEGYLNVVLLVLHSTVAMSEKVTHSEPSMAMSMFFSRFKHLTQTEFLA